MVPARGFGTQVPVLLAPGFDCSHWAIVWKLQFSAPDSLPLRQKAAFCCAMAAGVADNSAATTADEAMRARMG